MLTPEAAWNRISAEIEPLPVRDTPRQEAVGHCLARDLVATVDMPPADVSAMDGYALHGEVATGSLLPVAMTVAAGKPSPATLRPGQAAKIMTGAVVPEGADRVIAIERTDGGVQRVQLDGPAPEGQHIRRAGEVVKTGQPLLNSGTALTPGAISLLASHGYASVPTHRLPRVAVLATGDEVVPPESEPLAGQLRNSNGPFLLAAGRTLGLDFHSLGIAPDSVTGLRHKVSEGLQHDLTLLCGGVSMGDFDFGEQVLAELGCDILFDKVALQPGKPLVAARHRDSGHWVLGLPGNPASVMVTFWLFARPLLRRLQGRRDSFWQGALTARLDAPLPVGKDRDRFLAAEVRAVDGALSVTPQPPRGSHDVVSYSQGSALVRIRPHADASKIGDPCEILPLADWWLPEGPRGPS